MVIADIARVAHEVNRAYCQALGDDSQPLWEHAPAWQRDSAIQGVQMYADAPEITPEGGHAAWMATKIREGWVWGPIKNAKLKQHPCLVPFHELPMEQRAKDHLFRGVVLALAPMLHIN